MFKMVYNNVFFKMANKLPQLPLLDRMWYESLLWERGDPGQTPTPDWQDVWSRFCWDELWSLIALLNISERFPALQTTPRTWQAVRICWTNGWRSEHMKGCLKWEGRLPAKYWPQQCSVKVHSEQVNDNKGMELGRPLHSGLPSQTASLWKWGLGSGVGLTPRPRGLHVLTAAYTGETRPHLH